MNATWYLVNTLIFVIMAVGVIFSLFTICEANWLRNGIIMIGGLSYLMWYCCKYYGD